MGFNLKQYRKIYADIKAYIIASQNRVSDFNAGSVISSEIEAFSRELALAYSETRAGFSDVLKSLAFSIFDIERHEAQRAIGAVTFSRLDTSSEVSIALGTQVSTASGITFETTAAATMAVGASTATVPIRAVDAGKTGNVTPGSITIIVSGVTGVDSVSNVAKVGGGVDQESWAEYLSRFRAFLMGLGKSNKHGIIYGASLNQGIRSVGIIEHFPAKGGIYNFTVYLDDGAGTVSSAIVNQVRAVIDGTGTEADPGYRAAGINCDILAPSIVPIDVTGTVYISYAVERDEGKSLIETAITEFINAHIIGQTVVRAQLQKTILDYSWVLDLNITAPSENISITDGQIARIGTITLNYIQTSG